MVMVQHSNPRSAPAMDGCQVCLRESRGDRVVSGDKCTCPEASTWHVQFLFKRVEQVDTGAVVRMVGMCSTYFP